MPHSKRSKKSTPKISLNTSENNCSAYRDLLFVWFADKAVKYITGHNIYDINSSNFKDIFSEIKNFFDDYSKRFPFFKREDLAKKLAEKCPSIFIEKGDLELVPVPLVSSDYSHPCRPCDIKDIFSRSSIEKALGDALNENVWTCELKFTGLAVEFAYRIRGFMLGTRVKKRDIKVDKTVLALMDIGILLTYVGTITRNENREYLYLAIDWEPLVFEFLEPWRRVQAVAKQIVKAVLVKGEGSIRTALVGMAAAVAKALEDLQGKGQSGGPRPRQQGAKTLGDLRGPSAVRGEFVRIAVADVNRTMKSDVFDLLDLALIIQQYGLASPLFELTRGYPADPTARRFVDMVAEAVLRYQRHRDLGELYRVVRAAASPGVNEAGRSAYKNWDEIINQIIKGLSR